MQAVRKSAKGSCFALRFTASLARAVKAQWRIYNCPAKVTKVSTSALLRQEISVALAGTEDYYRVWVSLDKPYVHAYGEKIKVQSGMKVDADMLLEKRRIYEWLIEPVLSFSKSI